MSKEDKPLEYQRRIRDTKGIAQRLDLNYLKRPALMALLRRRMTWVVVALAALACVPLVMGVGSSRRVVANGPLSEAHAIYEDRCEVCHTAAFGGTPDAACQKCHDGAPHPAKSIDHARLNAAPSCAQCHMEHRGKQMLSQVADGNCTACHSDLTAHAAGVTMKATRITEFRAGSHPEFSAGAMKDLRPLRLNHAIHLPKESKTIRGRKLTMRCGDCHVTDRSSPTGAILPVTFEQNCKSCHARELEFDVNHVLGPSTQPAPHTRDARTIHEFVVAAYQDALTANPALVRRPVGNDVAPQANAAAWLDRMVMDSENYLFNRKCLYCHEGASNGVVKKLDPVAGRYPDAQPWLPRGEFSHRAHRAVECDSCHAAARTSRKTEDVLIPAMKSCLPCHGESRAGLDRCSMCHLYHNRSLERDFRGAGGAL
jgi:hypothetical protein